jgi:hypothetical protein
MFDALGSETKPVVKSDDAIEPKKASGYRIRAIAASVPP